MQTCAISIPTSKNYTIPALYAYVLNGPQVRDGTVLQEYLANTIETAKQNEQITTEQRDSLWSLTDQYVYKNADLLQNYFTDRGRGGVLGLYPE